MDFSDLLRIAKEFLVCPVCRSKFKEDKIKFKGTIDQKNIIEAKCANDHPSITILFVSDIMTDKNIINNESISNNEVLDLKLSLQKFNGDFNKVFKD